MMLTWQHLRDLAARAAAAAAGPAKVMVFGSYGRGDATEQSDLDLIVLEPAFADKAEEYLRIRKAIGLLGIGVDLLLYSDAEFDRRSTVKGTLPYRAKREGKLLYERPA